MAEGAAKQDAPPRFAERYRLVRRLGRGGMGAVFEVVDESSDERLALKALEREGTELAFRREFHTMARLAHPRIVTVHDFGVHAGRPFYTMELLDGEDLKQRAPVDWRTACSLLRDVASALALLHAQGLVHRDIAPRNVRSTSDGRAKIIDFGLVASAGSVTTQIGGTPPYVAPEAVRGAPIDHRLDLFSLGALGYWLLVGENAYPAKTLDELIAAWKQAIPKPSSRRADVDPALEDLVLALLSRDPLARPSSAAEVIERLTAIGDLPALPGVEARRGYLASAALVGRKKEVQRIRRHVGRALRGEGHAFVIAAASGTGKTRLLRELAFEAQLAGATLVRGDAGHAERSAYGLVRELARGLLDAVPGHALSAAEPHIPALVRVVPELRTRLHDATMRTLGDPAEDRMFLQASLRDWILAIAARTPLVFVVDDVQRADEASAGFLAALAHASAASRVLVAATVRTDEPPVAASRLAALEDAGTTLRLRGLDPPDVEELVRALFGDVANAARLAKWMQRVAGGSPLLCTELARHLVETERVRWTDGVWLIPESIEGEVPKRLEDAMDVRIANLPEGSLALAQSLAIAGGEVSLDLVVELGGGSSPGATFDLIAELVRQEVLVGAAESFRFRHDGLREAVIRTIGQRERVELHRRVARVLRAHRGDAAAGEIGLLHLRGEEPELAAPLLHEAARRAYDAQGFYDAIGFLEAALDANRRIRGSRRARLELLTMLVMSGSFHDREIALRYGAETIRELRRHAGVELASKLYRRIGRTTALAVGQLGAWSRWLFSRPRRRGPMPHVAIRDFFTVSGILVAVHATSYHRDDVEQLVESLEPVAILPNRIPYALYLFSKALLALIRGEIPNVTRITDRILSILASDHTTRLPEIQRRSATAAAHHLRAIAAVTRLEPTLDAELEAISKVGIRYFDLAAIHVRILKHLYRGEAQVVAALQAEAEPLALAIGSTWQLDGLIPIAAGYGYALLRDVVGLRRCVETLERMSSDGFGIAPFLDLVKGEYARERGQFDEAVARFQSALGDSPGVDQVVSSALAETLLAKGDVDGARRHAEVALQLGESPDFGSVFVRVRARRTLACALAIDGDFESARRRADEAIADASDTDVPLVLGLAHETRARIALMEGDRPEYERQRASARRWFVGTENPLLVARAARLSELGTAAAGPAPSATSADAVTSDADEAVTVIEALGRAERSQMVTRELVASGVRLATARTGLLSACRGPRERASLALALAVEATNAASGYLFLVEGASLELAAPRWGAEAPEVVRSELERLVEDAKGMGPSAQPLVASAWDWRLVVLRREKGHPFGALALLDATVPGDEEARFFDRLAHELTARASDVSDQADPPSHWS